MPVVRWRDIAPADRNIMENVLPGSRIGDLAAAVIQSEELADPCCKSMAEVRLLVLQDFVKQLLEPYFCPRLLVI